MNEEFKKAIKLILAHEAGYVNNPNDNGGETNKGITIGTYNDFKKINKERKFPPLSELTAELAMEIYWENYAKPIKFNQLPNGLNYALLDFAINSGVSRAVKTLQKILKVSVDGVLGLQTLNAIKSSNPKNLVMDLCEDRLIFVKRLKDFKHFGRGWTNRINDVRKNASAMLNKAPVEIKKENELTQFTPKAEGEFSVMGAIQDSRKTQGGVIALIGALISALPEAVEFVKPATDLFEGLSYAPILGNILTVFGALYIVLIKKKEF